MDLRKGQVVELEILSLAFGGAGIGKYDGLTVFVQGTMPGDKVKAAFTRIKSNFAEADLVEIVKGAADRKEPVCEYFGLCGGCQLQFMPYEKQLEIKRQQVVDSFERIGKIYGAPVRDVLGATGSQGPAGEYFYRNKMEFSFGYDKEMNFRFGMHIPGRRFDIFDIEKCYLQSEFTNQVVNQVRDFVKVREWVPFKFSCGEGFLRQLIMREGKRTGEVMAILYTSDDLPVDFEKELEKMVDELRKIEMEGKKLTSFYWLTVISKRGVPRQVKEKLIFGKEAMTEEMILGGGEKLAFDILPQAFFQVNTLQAEVLYSQVVEMAGLGVGASAGADRKLIYDLFCGTGTIGLFLAKYAERVVGVEINEDAVKSAKKNAEKNRIYNIDFLVGDVDKVVKELKEFPDLVVVDPPRAGVTPKLIEKISEFSAKQIVYVSCNPATLARDCSLLAEYGYKVKEVRPVDMFPQTFHIECVCLLER